MNPYIFREYDIRGHAEKDFDDRLVQAIGHALGTLIIKRQSQTKTPPRVAVGRDCRLSSPRLHTALVAGLTSTGLELVDVGVVPTPLLYFAVHHLRLNGGVQITGSHNPPADNGFKMLCGNQSLFGEDIQRLRQHVEEHIDRLPPPPSTPSIEKLDIVPAYAGYMRGNIEISYKDLRFAVDAGNGAGGPAALAAMRAVGLDPVPLLCEMDGHFPVHHPDPSEAKNLELLRNHVLEHHLEFGIAYDGDADRIGVIDSRGDVVWGDRLMVLFARAILKKHPNAAIIGEVKCSQTLYDDISAQGGRPILWKTGHSLIKSKMKEENALLAGEMSGHMFFADRYYGYDDAIYASLRLAEILAEEARPLHVLLENLPRTYSTPELRIPCNDQQKFQIVAAVRDHFQANHDVITIDGARIQFDQGWGLVRASNTQPILVLRFEAESEQALDAIQGEVKQVIEQVREHIKEA